MHTYKYNYLQKSKQTKDASHLYDLSKSVDYVAIYRPKSEAVSVEKCSKTVFREQKQVRKQLETARTK